MKVYSLDTPLEVKHMCLNNNTKKIVESENVNFDEHTEVQDDESIKRLEEYRSFVYFYDEMPTEEEPSNPIANQ